MKEKLLIIILRVCGFLLITAFIAVLLPYEIIAKIHKQIGLGSFPKLPILAYLARSVALFYAIHGFIILYISFDLGKYLRFLKLLCYVGFLFSISIFFVDMNAPMPPSWTFSEGPFVFFLNFLIFIIVVLIEKDNNKIQKDVERPNPTISKKGNAKK